MRIVEVRVHPYRIPLRQPFVTAHGTLAAREGAIIELVTDDGMTGLGDMAAVTEFGAPDLPTLLRALEKIIPTLQELRPSDIVFEVAQQAHSSQDAFGALPAPALFAVETAALYLLNASQHAPTATQPATFSLWVNATVGAADVEAASMAARARVADGFTCIKLKVGMCATVVNEVNRIKAVAKAIGRQVRLRLDANEAWTFDEAREILLACSDVDLEYIEQPLPRADLAGMRMLREVTGMRIAADEALTDLASVKRVCEMEAADILVIKPQLLGGYFAVGRVVKLVMKQGKAMTFTTTLESGVGTAATLRIAQIYQHDVPVLACGLGTLPLLEDNLIMENLPIQAGMMRVPTGPGLGVTLDRAALEKYRI